MVSYFSAPSLIATTGLNIEDFTFLTENLLKMTRLRDGILLFDFDSAILPFRIGRRPLRIVCIGHCINQ
jgi:hypothetical protein